MKMTSGSSLTLISSALEVTKVGPMQARDPTPSTISSSMMKPLHLKSPISSSGWTLGTPSLASLPQNQGEEVSLQKLKNKIKEHKSRWLVVPRRYIELILESYRAWLVMSSFGDGILASHNFLKCSMSSMSVLTHLFKKTEGWIHWLLKPQGRLIKIKKK